MSDNSVIGPTQGPKEVMVKSSIKWRYSIWLSISGLLSLGFAMSSVLGMSGDFKDDIYMLAFIENWMSWICVAFFALGWFLTHWAEVELLKNWIGEARLLIVIIIVISLSFYLYFRFVSQNEVLRQFKLASFFLIYSGYLLRYSIFREESFVKLQIPFWSKSA